MDELLGAAAHSTALFISTTQHRSQDRDLLGTTTLSQLTPNQSFMTDALQRHQVVERRN
jgi:hypothetical protein